MSILSRRGSWYSLDLTNENEKDKWLYEHSLEHDDIIGAVNTLGTQTLSSLPFSYSATAQATLNPHSNQTIAVGWWLIYCDSNTRVAIYNEVAALWEPMSAYGGAGLFVSDGVNLRLENPTAGTSYAYMRGVE